MGLYDSISKQRLFPYQYQPIGLVMETCRVFFEAVTKFVSI